MTGRCGHHRVRRAAAGLVVAAVVTVATTCDRRGDLVLLLTADTEGAIRACATCSADIGLGDVSRRATAVARLRRDAPSALLVDAGNFLFGPDSIDSGGRIAIAAYNALGYDAVNLSYRDFRLGEAATVVLLKAARVPVVSANVLDDSSGRLIAAPYVVRPAGAVRVALLGVTDLPAGVAALGHIETQLTGVRVRPPVEALGEWLPKAEAASDRVVLLFYGSADVLSEITRRFGTRIAAIGVGNLRPAELPDRSNPPLVGAAQRGTDVTEAALGGDGRVAVTRFPIDQRYPADPNLLNVLRSIR